MALSNSDVVEFSGLRLHTSASVYVPHEDSFLLADAARVTAKGRVLDLGCGTGIAGLSAAQNESVTEVVFADVNPAALTLAEKNTMENKVEKPHSFVHTDLFSALDGEQFDTVCFNPPYMPTAKAEKIEGLENAAYDGGSDGRKVLDRFLKQFAYHLAPNGILLLLNSSVSANDGVSGNAETQRKLEGQGFQVKGIALKSFFFEQLVVFEAKKERN